MADLPTNYYDDILSASMNGKKKFRLTYRNGTTEEVTIEDISEYDQYGSKFGAGDINKTNQAVNEKFDSGDVVDPMLTTEQGFAADAYQTKLQFDELGKKIEKVFQLGTDRKAQLIGSLANTNLGLTENSSWEDIFNALDTLFPEQYNVLTKLTSSDWTKSGGGSSSISSGKLSLSCSGGSYTTLTSKEILASGFTKIICTWSKNNSDYRNGLGFSLVHSGGSIDFNEGTSSIDISKITGNIHFVATAKSNYVGEEIVAGGYSSGSMSVSSLILYAK